MELNEEDDEFITFVNNNDKTLFSKEEIPTKEQLQNRREYLIDDPQRNNLFQKSPIMQNQETEPVDTPEPEPEPEPKAEPEPEPKPLPKGWRKVKSRTAGKMYYVNPTTGQTTWNREDPIITEPFTQPGERVNVRGFREKKERQEARKKEKEIDEIEKKKQQKACYKKCDEEYKQKFRLKGTLKAASKGKTKKRKRKKTKKRKNKSFKQLIVDLFKN